MCIGLARARLERQKWHVSKSKAQSTREDKGRGEAEQRNIIYCLLDGDNPLGTLDQFAGLPHGGTPVRHPYLAAGKGPQKDAQKKNLRARRTKRKVFISCWNVRFLGRSLGFVGMVSYKY